MTLAVRHLIVACMFLLLVNGASGQIVSDFGYAEVTVVDSLKTWYIVRYDYDDRYATVPATNPPGKPHYDATITVYRLVGKREIVGWPFAGTYVEGGCFEDVPENWVKIALDNEAHPEREPKPLQLYEFSDMDSLPVIGRLAIDTLNFTFFTLPLYDTLFVTQGPTIVVTDSSGKRILTIDTRRKE